MATADISSSFVIRVIQTVAASEILNVANPGRAFTIQEVQIKFIAVQADISTSAVQVTKVPASGATTNLFTTALTASRTNYSRLARGCQPPMCCECASRNGSLFPCHR